MLTILQTVLLSELKPGSHPFFNEHNNVPSRFNQRRMLDFAHEISTLEGYRSLGEISLKPIEKMAQKITRQKYNASPVTFTECPIQMIIMLKVYFGNAITKDRPDIATAHCKKIACLLFFVLFHRTKKTIAAVRAGKELMQNNVYLLMYLIAIKGLLEVLEILDVDRLQILDKGTEQGEPPEDEGLRQCSDKAEHLLHYIGHYISKLTPRPSDSDRASSEHWSHLVSALYQAVWDLFPLDQIIRGRYRRVPTVVVILRWRKV